MTLHSHVYLYTMASQQDMFGADSQNLEGDEVHGDPELPQDGQVAVEENFGEERANDYDPKTKHTVKFKEGELDILVDHLKSNLENLTSHIKTNEYRRGRREAWTSLVNAINLWNETNGTGVIRSAPSIKTKMDNLKYRSKSG